MIDPVHDPMCVLFNRRASGGCECRLIARVRNSALPLDIPAAIATLEMLRAQIDGAITTLQSKAARSAAPTTNPPLEVGGESE